MGINALLTAKWRFCGVFRSKCIDNVVRAPSGTDMVSLACSWWFRLKGDRGALDLMQGTSRKGTWVRHSVVTCVRSPQYLRTTSRSANKKNL